MMNLYARSIPGMCLFVVAVNYTLMKCGASEVTMNVFALAVGWLSVSLVKRDERRLKEAA